MITSMGEMIALTGDREVDQVITQLVEVVTGRDVACVSSVSQYDWGLKKGEHSFRVTGSFRDGVLHVDAIFDHGVDREPDIKPKGEKPRAVAK